MSDWNTNLINDMRAHEGHATSGPFVGRQVLILTTTGAKTGERRESPLAYTLDGDRIVIVASKGGADTNPAWYHNLVEHPDVTVELNGKRFDAIASVATGAERRRLYDGHVAVHPGFADYEKKTTRVIPVIVLQRKAASAAA
ncbi:MAG TPA: nitroreductase family deazaflavin-dependent oxidoreductase [Candidatus Limnocylindrales bacterium]|jgi:deazaflavin-dependent oxidoreductase (nitroreductase family)|nr:nitroreductase family deazaflavin-dependent oxidoreductase [Candidatus Limnocylindrales bacterium]